MTMTESILKSLMRLFSIAAQIHTEERDREKVRVVVQTYLKTQVRPDNVNQYLIMFDFYQNGMRERETKTDDKQLALYSVKAMIICEEINMVLVKKQKLLALLQLIEILIVNKNTGINEVDFIRTIAHSFKFPDYIFDLCYPLAMGELKENTAKDKFLIIAEEFDDQYTDIKFIKREYLRGKLIFLELPREDLYIFKYEGEDTQLWYNGSPLIPFKTYIFEKGTAIKSVLAGNILYSEIVKPFLRAKNSTKIQLHVNKLHFHFSDSPDGIYPFNLVAESGQLIGIMGGSGVGKSTLLSLLGGIIKPKSGEVLLNGYNILNSKDALSGVIGYISQDDILIEELTVYQNLYYNARLCFRNYSEEKIIQKVDSVLHDFDLYEIKALKVGSALNKYISGGQRKRLNIAIELIREPFFLLVDEPTSGLSSNDSEKVVDLLKEQSLKGKLVIINIHQPSSDVFKRFDKILVIDKGGRIIFQGSPVNSAQYFKHHFRLTDADDSECPTCGNISPEDTLQTPEIKKVNQFGDYTNERIVLAEEWYDKYLKEQDKDPGELSVIKLDLPKNDFEIPGRLEQFKIFIQRNLLSKLSNKQYLLINLLEAPLLAFILAWFCKYNAGTPENFHAYIFSENMNLPVYIFMSVIVAMFMGLMLSAEEIINDRKIIQRERLLNLSRFSYFNSKVVFVASISAIQMLLFVLIGNRILEIKGMYLNYWLMLFLTAVLANLLGLILSSTLKSVVAIYILIPLLLVPQILMGGAMIRFDQLNSKLSHPKYVPFIGDVMISRWAYEGMAVNQFKSNAFQWYFFENQSRESNASYIVNSWLPELNGLLDETKHNLVANSDLKRTEENLNLICEELQKMSSLLGHKINWFEFNSVEHLGQSFFTQAYDYLEEVKTRFHDKLEIAMDENDKAVQKLSDQLGGPEMVRIFKDTHFNEALADLLLNKKQTQKLRRYKSELIRLDEPVYMYPTNTLGRAHFYAPYKRVGNFLLNTYWFNITVLILMLLCWYILLIFEVFPNSLKWYARLNVYHNVLILPQRIKNAFNPLRKF